MIWASFCVQAVTHTLTCTRAVNAVKCLSLAIFLTGVTGCNCLLKRHFNCTQLFVETTLRLINVRAHLSQFLAHHRARLCNGHPH